MHRLPVFAVIGPTGVMVSIRKSFRHTVIVRISNVGVRTLFHRGEKVEIPIADRYCRKREIIGQSKVQSMPELRHYTAAGTTTSSRGFRN